MTLNSIDDIHDSSIHDVSPRVDHRGLGPDGAGSAASFAYPAGVAVDNADNIYVADYTNHTIRKVTLAGKVVSGASVIRLITKTVGVSYSGQTLILSESNEIGF